MSMLLLVPVTTKGVVFCGDDLKVALNMLLIEQGMAALC